MTDNIHTIIRRLREALAKGPTPGPWFVNRPMRNSLPHILSRKNGHYVVDAPPRSGMRHAMVRQANDAEFICAANPAAIAALLDHIEAQNSRIAQLTARLDAKAPSVRAPLAWYGDGE